MFFSNTSAINTEQQKPPNELELPIEWLIIRNTELEKSNYLLINEIAELRRLEMIRKSQTDLVKGEKNV
jgi:hypothetical protein